MDIAPVFCPYCGSRLKSSTAPNDPPLHLHTTADFTPGSAIESTPVDDKIPATIGGYRLNNLLGTGGMGQVYEAVSLSTDQVVAVKLLSSRLSSSPTSLERFRQEGRLASQISHPLCVFVYAADTEAGRPYIVMERMPGETLKEYVDRKGPLPTQEAIPLILDVIDGLREAHRLGFIHRDVKPSNCFLTKDGRVKIGDFGLSRSLTKENSLTQTGAFLGTVLYASPEQIRGETVDFASDVYSVCATLFHMLTARAPFQNDNMTAALAQIISERAPSIRKIRPEISTNLEKILDKGLERDRERRYATLEELREALVVLIPGSMRYGEPTIRVAAYAIDEIVLRLALTIPLTYLLKDLLPRFTLSLFDLAIFVLYFSVLEWRFGASVGKRLLGLRVFQRGSTDSPRYGKILLRTVLFAAILGFQFLDPSFAGGDRTARRVLEFAFLIWVVTGILLLLLPMRASKAYRGFHERLTGTCVLRLPFRTKPIRIESVRGNRLRQIASLPPDVKFDLKPYSIEGGLKGPGPEDWLLLGEDKLLGRRLLFHLQPTRNDISPQRQSVQRTTRLRLLSTGTTQYDGREYLWSAYVAPQGAPLTDIATPEQKLLWPETRLILEQLVDELLEAKKDGTLPRDLNLDLIWVQQDGRMQLLDFPIVPAADNRAEAADEVHLIRRALRQSLQGDSHSGDATEPIQAPLPDHARAMIENSLTDSREDSLSDLKRHLKESRNQPQQVNTRMRLFQLGLMSAFLSLGLFSMFAAAASFTVILVVSREEAVKQTETFLRAVRSPEKFPKWQQNEQFLALSHEPQIEGYLQSLAADIREEERNYRKGLTGIERLFYSMAVIEDTGASHPNETIGVVAKMLAEKQQTDRTAGNVLPTEGVWIDFAYFILFWPILWGILAFGLRGGLSLIIGRMRLVRTDGRKISRIICFARTIVIWLPVGLLLVFSVWLQAHLPGWAFSHAMFWIALGLVVGYIVHALKHPEQSWLDKQFGTMLIPK